MISGSDIAITHSDRLATYLATQSNVSDTIFQVLPDEYRQATVFLLPLPPTDQ